MNLKFQQYDTGTIIQEPIKAHIAIASTFTSPDVEYLDKAPTNKIKGKHIGHTKSEIDATIFSNCSKKEKIKKLNNIDLICPHCLLLSKI